MPGLIQKSGYIKPGNGGSHYAEYIATREGVELIEAPPPSHDGGGYLEYMAQRPRSHGLFSADGPADLEKTMEEINGHTGPVWTFVYSLKREDAHRLGYENGESWRRLLLAHQAELATAMKIPPSNFRWCAAFHDEKHHPHIHMMVWSADPKQGFLTEKGIEKMRSQLSNEIFRDELLSLYQQKDLSYSQVRDAATEAMGRLIREMETGLCHSSIIMEQMETLAGMLECHKGKKVYGYLKKPVKAQVDAIVDELAKIPEVAQCYEQWNQLRDELERYYKDSPREYLPLSQQEEFKAIKNMVIREAERLRLGTFTFEDASMKDEVDEDQDAVCFAWNSSWRMAEVYQSAKEVLEEYENPEEEKAEQVQVLEQLWQRGFPLAAYQLGKCWRDGRGVLPDDEQAELWFQRAADAGYDFANTHWESSCKAKIERMRRYPGMEKRRRRRTPAPPTAWESCIWRGKMFRKTCKRRWPISPTPPNMETSTPSTLLENCTSLGRASNRIGSGPGRISMNRRNREMSTPTSFWSTSIRCAGPMCSWRPPDCSTI